MGGGVRTAAGRYFRVYYDQVEGDPKFDGIRSDPLVMGCWQFIGVEADKAWPSPFFAPPTVPRRVLDELVSRGIVDRVGDGKCRLHGMDAERIGRSIRAADAAASRWGSKGNADRTAGSNADRTAGASAHDMPSRAEPSKSRTKGERDVVVHDGAREPEGTVVIGLGDPSGDQHRCPTCGRRMVEAGPGRWVCTNAPGHGTAVGAAS